MGSETHESLKVEESLEEEIQKALVHELTDADIERAQLLLGIDTPRRNQELFTEQRRQSPQNDRRTRRFEL